MKRSVVLFSFLCLMSFAGRMAAQVSRASIHEPKSPHHSAELIDQPKELIPPSHANHQEPMMEPPHGLLEAPAIHAAPQPSRQAPADRSEMTRPASAAAHRAPTATATGQSGTVGEDIQWELKNGTLTFSGEGEVQEIVDWTEVAPQVTDVVFEEGITGICAYFFYGIGYFGQVVSLSLPATVTHIDAYAFWDFHNLQTTTIASITAPQLDPNAFYIWHTLVVPDGYSQAYNNVEPWYWFNITDPGTFACGDGLTCCYNALDHHLEVYGKGPMWTDVDLVRGHETDIQRISIGDGVTSLADGAFQNLSLIEYINFPLSLEQIGSYAFAGDAQLREINLPRRVESIGQRAFQGCTSLEYISCQSAVAPPLGEDALTSVAETGTLAVPEGSDYSSWMSQLPEGWTVQYTNSIVEGQCSEQVFWSFDNTTGELAITGEGPMESAPWGGYWNMIESVEIDNGITSLAPHAFQNCIYLRTISIPKSVIAFGEDSNGDGSQFENCSTLTSVTFEEGCQLTNIPPYAFSWCNNLQSITIPKSVTTFGEDSHGQGYQFCDCYSLSSVVFEEGSQLTNIPSYAFYYCQALQSITIPKSVTTFGKDSNGQGGQFAYCSSLSAVTFESSSQLKNIPSYAFYYCEALQSITIPKSVTTFGEDYNGNGRQFYYCSSLSSVTFESGSQLTNIPSYAFYYCGALQSITIPKSVATFGEGSNGQGVQFAYCSSLTSVTFESGSLLTNIPSYAFYYCEALQSITIPKSVTTFGEDYNGRGNQFAYCSFLSSVLFESGSLLTEIASHAFDNCISLQSINLPNSVVSFGVDNYNQGAQFYNCSSLTSVKFEDDSQLEELPNWTFGWCTALKSITIPKSVTSFGQDRTNGWGCQFCACESLQTVIFEEGSKLTEIASHAFEECVSLQSIKIPNSVTTFTTDINNVGSQFNWCESLTSVEFEKGSRLTELPSYAFNECYLLESITIPKSVIAFGTTIDGWGGQFSDCQSLRDVTFEQGGQLTNISAYAFNNCSSLQSITALTNEVPSLSTDVFTGLPETGILTIHAGKDFSSWMEQLPEGWTLNQVSAFAPGDLDGDGKVSISDAVGIINFIIHSATEGLDEQAADMNGDGVISIADAVMAVNTVLHVNGAAASGRRLPMADVDATLAMSPMTVAKNTTFDLPVILNGAANAYTALQSTLHLPQGVALTAVTSADGHAVRYAEQEDGSICMVSLSLSNATFAGNGDAIFILHLQTDDTFEGGLVMLDEMEIVMPSLHASHPSAVGALLTEGTTTIGSIPMTDGEHTEYDLSGRVGQGTQGVYIEKGKKYYRK